MNKTNIIAVELANDFIARIVDGTIKKDNLANHGRPFTGGPEKNALLTFRNYIGSYGYLLMEKRISTRDSYYGY